MNPQSNIKNNQPKYFGGLLHLGVRQSIPSNSIWNCPGVSMIVLMSLLCSWLSQTTFVSLKHLQNKQNPCPSHQIIFSLSALFPLNINISLFFNSCEVRDFTRSDRLLIPLLMSVWPITRLIVLLELGLNTVTSFVIKYWRLYLKRSCYMDVVSFF